MPSKIPYRQRLPLLRIVKGVRFEWMPRPLVTYDDGGVRFESNGSTLH